MDKNTFTVIDEFGKKKVCNVLFTFDSDETNKSYIAYTDNSKDSSGNIQVYASSYNPKNENEMELLPIETEKEWKVIEAILGSLQDEIRDKMGSSNN